MTYQVEPNKEYCPTCNIQMKWLPFDMIWECLNRLCKDFGIQKMNSHISQIIVDEIK